MKKKIIKLEAENKKLGVESADTEGRLSCWSVSDIQLSLHIKWVKITIN